MKKANVLTIQAFIPIGIHCFSSPLSLLFLCRGRPVLFWNAISCPCIIQAHYQDYGLLLLHCITLHALRTLYALKIQRVKRKLKETRREQMILLRYDSDCSLLSFKKYPLQKFEKHTQQQRSYINFK